MVGTKRHERERKVYLFIYLFNGLVVGIIRDPIPWWVWLYSGVFHFIAHTLDGIDGKQARRTKSSSPLGILFMQCIV